MIIDSYRAGGHVPFPPPPPPSEYPVYLEAKESFHSSLIMSHAVELPELEVGDRAIVQVFFCSTFSTTITPPSGLNLLLSAGQAMRVYWFDVEEEPESPAVLQFSTSVNRAMVALVHRIQAGTFDPEEAPEGDVVTATTTTPDPPSLSPSWGEAKTLWIAGFCGISQNSAPTFPYSANNKRVISNPGGPGGAGHGEAASCTAEIEADTVDPGTFSRTINQTTYAFTIAVKPVVE